MSCKVTRKRYAWVQLVIHASLAAYQRGQYLRANVSTTMHRNQRSIDFSRY